MLWDLTTKLTLTFGKPLNYRPGYPGPNQLDSVLGVVVEGLDVPHAHIHLVPLYDRDTLQLHHDYPVDISDERLDNIANSIKVSV